jgi:hypothetical protein
MKKGGSIPFRSPAQNVVPFLECGRLFQDAMEHQKQSFLSLHGSIPLTTKLQGLHNIGSNNWCRRALFGCRNVGSSIKYRNKSRIKYRTYQLVSTGVVWVSKRWFKHQVPQQKWDQVPHPTIFPVQYDECNNGIPSSSSGPGQPIG